MKPSELVKDFQSLTQGVALLTLTFFLDRIEYASNDAIVASNIALVIGLNWSLKNSSIAFPNNLENLIVISRLVKILFF